MDILHYLNSRGKDGQQLIPRLKVGRAVMLALILIFVGAHVFAQDESNPTILVLFSYSSSFASYNDQISGLKSVFPEELYHLDFEFLDSKRFPEGPVREKIISALIEKMRCADASKYDCILTADDNALRFVLEHRPVQCASIPVFFFGVNNRQLAYAQDENPRVTGVVEDISIEENLTMIRTLFPGDVLRVVTDGTSSGQGDLQTLRDIAAASSDYRFLKIVDLSSLSWEEAGRELAEARGEPILLLSAFSDRNRELKSFEEGLITVLDMATGPVFHLWTHGLGDGIAGGILVSQFEQARTAALLAEEFLSSPSYPLPPVVRDSPNRAIFDYNVIRKWEISSGYLPPSSRMINRPLAFLEEYRYFIVYLSVFIIFLLLIILLLVYLLHRTREAERYAGSTNRKWQTYINSSPLGILVADKEGHICESNPMASTLMGLDEAELNGEREEDLFAGRYGDPGGMIILDYRDPAGSRKKLSIDTSDIEGNGRLIFIRDVTEHQQYQQQKELRQKELQAIIDLMPSMIFMKDRDGHFLMVNKACAESMGRPVKEVLGKNHRELHFEPGEIETMLAEDRTVIDSGEPMTIWDEKLTLPAGGTVHMDVVKLPFQSFDSGETVMLGMAHDVSEKYNLQEGVRRSERLRSLGVLAGGVAHDFNNQLMGILGYLELAKTEEISEKARTYLEGVRSAADRSAELVQNLLGFSREKAKKLSPADVHSLLKEVVSLVQASRRRGIVYLSELNSVHSVIPCDAGMVENAFFHVVLNASQAIHSEGEVRITTRDVLFEDLPPEELTEDIPEGKFLLVEVEDNGAGMSEDIRTRIFEPFFTTRSEEGGSGMGLSLVYGTVKNHHGVIQIESLPDEGTVVRIYLPVRD